MSFDSIYKKSSQYLINSSFVVVSVVVRFQVIMTFSVHASRVDVRTFRKFATAISFSELALIHLDGLYFCFRFSSF